MYQPLKMPDMYDDWRLAAPPEHPPEPVEPDPLAEQLDKYPKLARLVAWRATHRAAGRRS